MSERRSIGSCEPRTLSPREGPRGSAVARGRRMGDRDDAGKPPAAEAPDEAGAGDGRGQTLGRLAPQDRGEHPSSGRLEAVSDFVGQAQRYLILIEGGPPSNYSAWSPDLPGCVATGASLE